MAIVTAFGYKDLFDDIKINPHDLIKNIPSKFVIGMLSIITDTITIKKNSRDTQIFLLNNFTVNVKPIERKRIFSRAMPKINAGYELFAILYSVEFINKELINYRDEGMPPSDNYGEDEINFLKAYLTVADGINERDVKEQKIAIENAKRGGNFLIELLWPHLIRQFEFSHRPDVIYEGLKGFALMSFFEAHPKFGSFIKEYVQQLNCKNGAEYISILLSLIASGLKRVESNNPMHYMNTIRISQPDPLIESMIIDPKVVQLNKSKQINYLGMREKPVMKFRDQDYIFPHLDYVYGAFFTGLVFSFYNNSGIKKLYDKSKENDGFGTFKGEIGKQFSEAILFKQTILKCFSRKHETLEFFENDDTFNPDCYYRRGNDIFIIEFKDSSLSSKTIMSGKYENIKAAIDERFATEKVKDAKVKIKSQDKGIFQLKRNIELLVSNQKLFWEIDKGAKNRKLELKNMKIRPVLVHTNIYFDLPGINDYLDQILQDKIDKSRIHFKSIEPFTMINLHYFYERALLFANSYLQLEKELSYHYAMIVRHRSQALKTKEPNDWFNALQPFGTFLSPKYRKVWEYQRNSFLDEIRSCWNIKINF